MIRNIFYPLLVPLVLRQTSFGIAGRFVGCLLSEPDETSSSMFLCSVERSLGEFKTSVTGSGVDKVSVVKEGTQNCKLQHFIRKYLQECTERHRLCKRI